MDTGANVGHHSLFISGFAKKVICFEPFPTFYKLIEEKIRINKIVNIDAYNVGLSNKNEELLYYAPAENQSNKGTESFVKDYNSGINPSFILNLTTGDEFVKKHHIENIDFIKINVEGFEKEVLEGLSNLIIESTPIIFMEFSTFTATKVGSFHNLQKLFHNSYKFYYYDKYNSKKELLNFDDIGPDIIAIPNRFKKKLINTFENIYI